MITTLEDFKQAAIELCRKYGLDNQCYVGIVENIAEDKMYYRFSHYRINLFQIFEGTIAEDVLTIVENEMQKLSDPLNKAKIHLENLNKELIAAGKQPLSIE